MLLVVLPGEDCIDEVGVMLAHLPDADMSKRLKADYIEHENTRELFQLLLILFVDDTSLANRMSRFKEQEEETISTLAAWGEDIHPGTTTRITTAPNPGEQFAAHARLLGAYVSGDGSHMKTHVCAANKI